MGFGGGSKGPSAAKVQQMQEQAAKKERERITLEEAQNTALDQEKLQTAYADQTNKRRDFAAGVAPQDDETSRRKFLRGV
jgi:hypothetical protein